MNAKDAVYYLNQKALKAPEHFTRFVNNAVKKCCGNGENQRTDFQCANLLGCPNQIKKWKALYTPTCILYNIYEKEGIKMGQEKGNKEERRAALEALKGKSMDFKKGHIYCPVCGFCADTFWMDPGDLCKICGEGKFVTFPETAIL